MSFSDADLRAALSEIKTGLDSVAQANKTLADALNRSNSQNAQQSRSMADSLRALARGNGAGGAQFSTPPHEHAWDYAAQRIYYEKGKSGLDRLNKVNQYTSGAGQAAIGGAASLGLPTSFTKLTQDFNKTIGGVGRAYQDTITGMQSALQNLPAMMDMGRSLGFVGDQALKSYQSVRQLGVQMQLSTADTIKMTQTYNATRVFAGTPAQAQQDLHQYMAVAGGAYRGMGMSVDQGNQTMAQSLNYFDSAGASQFANTLAIAEARSGTQTSQLQIAQRSMQYLEIMSQASVTGPSANASDTASFLTSLATQGQPAFNAGANAGASLMQQANTQGSLAQNIMIAYAAKLDPRRNFFENREAALKFGLPEQVAAVNNVYGSGTDVNSIGLKSLALGMSPEAYRAMNDAVLNMQSLPQEQKDRLAALNKLQATDDNPTGNDVQDYKVLTNIVANDAAGHGKQAVMDLINKNKLQKETGIHSVNDISDPYTTLNSILQKHPEIAGNLLNQFKSSPDAVGKSTSGIENAANNGALDNLDAVNKSLQAETVAVNALAGVMGKAIVLLPAATIGGALIGGAGGFLRGFLGGGRFGGGGGGSSSMRQWMEKMSSSLSQAAQCGCGTEEAVRSLATAPAESKVPEGVSSLAALPFRSGFGAPYVEQSPGLVQNLIKTLVQDVALMGATHSLSSDTVNQLAQQTGMTPAQIQSIVQQTLAVPNAPAPTESTLPSTGTISAANNRTTNRVGQLAAANAATAETVTKLASDLFAKAGGVGAFALGAGGVAGQDALNILRGLGGLAGRVGRGTANEGTAVGADAVNVAAGGGRATVSSIEDAARKAPKQPPGGWDNLGGAVAAAALIAAIVGAIVAAMRALNGAGGGRPQLAGENGLALGSMRGNLSSLAGQTSSFPTLGPFVNVGGLLVPTLRQTGGSGSIGGFGSGFGGGFGSPFGPGGGLGGGDSRNNPFARAMDDNTNATDRLTGRLDKALTTPTALGMTGSLGNSGAPLSSSASSLIFGSPFDGGGTKGSASSATGGKFPYPSLSSASTTNTTMSGFNQYQPLSESQYRDIITKAGFANSPLLSDPGSYASLMKSAKNANVDPRLMLAIAQQEGGYATALPYMSEDKNFTGIKYAGQDGATPGAISSEGNPYAKFSTWDQGWDAIGKTLRNSMIGPYVNQGDLRGATNMWTKGDPNNDAGGAQKRDIYGRILAEAPVIGGKVGGAFGNSLANGAATNDAGGGVYHAMSTDNNAYRAFDAASGGTDIAGELVSSIMSGLEQARPGIASAVAAMFKSGNVPGGSTPPPPAQSSMPPPFTDIHLTPTRAAR